MKRVTYRVFALLLCALLFMACGSETTGGNGDQLDFTVVPEADIPQELLNIIKDKKDEVFRLTYSTSENLYVAIGYGTQKTSGYSITVDEVSLLPEQLYIRTTLIGPAQEEPVYQIATHPYVVIRMEILDMTERTVVFE